MHFLPHIHLYVKRGIACDLIHCYELKFIMQVCKSHKGKFQLTVQQCYELHVSLKSQQFLWAGLGLVLFLSDVSECVTKPKLHKLHRVHNRIYNHYHYMYACDTNRPHVSVNKKSGNLLFKITLSQTTITKQGLVSKRRNIVAHK